MSSVNFASTAILLDPQVRPAGRLYVQSRLRYLAFIAQGGHAHHRMLSHRLVDATHHRVGMHHQAHVTSEIRVFYPGTFQPSYALRVPVMTTML